MYVHTYIYISIYIRKYTIHIYIYTYIQTPSDNASQLVESKRGSESVISEGVPYP